jgi:hypothetical protein
LSSDSDHGLDQFGTAEWDRTLDNHDSNVSAFAPEDIRTLLNFVCRGEEGKLERRLRNVVLVHPVLRMSANRNVSKPRDIGIVVLTIRHAGLDIFGYPSS